MKAAVVKRAKLAQDLLWTCFFGQSVNLICGLYLLARDLLLLLDKGQVLAVFENTTLSKKSRDRTHVMPLIGLKDWVF